VKQTGTIPPDYQSLDCLYERIEFPLPQEVISHWKTEFEGLLNGKEEVLFVLVDGFLLYWHQVSAPVHHRIDLDYVRIHRKS
jgi:hypothetical protein